MSEILCCLLGCKAAIPFLYGKEESCSLSQQQRSKLLYLLMSTKRALYSSTRSGSGASPPLSFSWSNRPPLFQTKKAEQARLFLAEKEASSSLSQQEIRELLYSSTGDERAPPFHKPSLTANRRAPLFLNGKTGALLLFFNRIWKWSSTSPCQIGNLRGLICC